MSTLWCKTKKQRPASFKGNHTSGKTPHFYITKKQVSEQKKRKHSSKRTKGEISTKRTHFHAVLIQPIIITNTHQVSHFFVVTNNFSHCTRQRLLNTKTQVQRGWAQSIKAMWSRLSPSSTEVPTSRSKQPQGCHRPASPRVVRQHQWAEHGKHSAFPQDLRNLPSCSACCWGFAVFSGHTGLGDSIRNMTRKAIKTKLGAHCMRACVRMCVFRGRLLNDL